MANHREEAYYGEAADKLKWLEVFLGVLLTLVVVGVLTFVLIFGAGDGGVKAPTIFGYTIYLNKATQIEDVPPGVVVIARDDKVDELGAGDLALCRVGDAQAVTLLRVVKVEEAGDGVFYTLKTDSAPDNQTIRVSRQDVVAEATGKNEFLGGILSFTSTTLGVVVLVLVPCLLFIGWQVVRIIRYRREMEEEAGYTEPAEEEEEDYSGATFRRRGAPAPVQEEDYGEYYEEDSQMDYQGAEDILPENPTRRTVIVPKDRVVVPLTGQNPAPKPQQTYINEGRAEYRRGAPANSNAKELANVMQSASRQRAGIPNRPMRNTIPEEQPKPVRTAPPTPPTSPSANAANAYSRVAKQSQPQRSTSGVQPQPTPQRRSAAPVPVAAPTPAYKEPIAAQPRRVNPAAAFPAAPVPSQQRAEEPVMSGAVSGVRRPEPSRTPELSRPNNPLQSGQGVSTIPPSAARPRQTIAPPPKSSNNKAVDDLMRVIDQAESGMHKK